MAFSHRYKFWILFASKWIADNQWREVKLSHVAWNRILWVWTEYFTLLICLLLSLWSVMPETPCLQFQNWALIFHWDKISRFSFSFVRSLIRVTSDIISSYYLTNIIAKFLHSQHSIVYYHRWLSWYCQISWINKYHRNFSMNCVQIAGTTASSRKTLYNEFNDNLFRMAYFSFSILDVSLWQAINRHAYLLFSFFFFLIRTVQSFYLMWNIVIGFILTPNASHLCKIDRQIDSIEMAFFQCIAYFSFSLDVDECQEFTEFSIRLKFRAFFKHSFFCWRFLSCRNT